MLANLRMMRAETTEAIIAIKRTLALEPRHFGALAVLGTVMESLGDDKAALAAFDASLKINPNQDDVKQQASTLRRKLDGDRI
jgi:cytochrome c-type biogenesis protein CcmH/NrfG